MDNEDIMGIYWENMLVYGFTRLMKGVLLEEDIMLLRLGIS
jgi:hypothetical protein